MKLTASNFGAALGLSPWQSRQKLFRVMLGIEPRDPMNANMQWGIDNELTAVAGVEAHTGIVFDFTGKNQRHLTVEIDGVTLGATPDGSCGSTGIEVKCPSKLPDEIPPHYVPQILGQCLIAGFDSVFFSAWTPTEQRIWHVPRSSEYIEFMLPLLTEFIDYLKSDTEPKRKKKVIPPDFENERIL